MNPKYRMLYLLIGFAGLVFLIIDILINLPDFNPVTVLMVSVPDMVVFFLAYKTYPADEPDETMVRTPQRLTSKI